MFASGKHIYGTDSSICLAAAAVVLVTMIFAGVVYYRKEPIAGFVWCL